MIDAALVPFWSSELVKVALEDAGITAVVVELRVPPGRGMPMARVFVPEDRVAEAVAICDDVMVQ